MNARLTPLIPFLLRFYFIFEKNYQLYTTLIGRGCKAYETRETSRKCGGLALTT